MAGTNKVWIGAQEAPADSFALELDGCTDRLDRAKGFRKAFAWAPLTDEGLRHRELGGGAWAGSVLSQEGHLLLHCDGQRVTLRARAFRPGSEALVIRAVESAVLRLLPKRVRFLPADGDAGWSDYPPFGDLFVRKTVQVRSEFQTIAVGHHPVYGKMLFLNGETQIASSDEPLYSKSLVAPAVGKRTRRVCILGGGDCGVLREVLAHPQVEEVVMVEIDQQVIEVCAQHFPQVVAGSREDPRAKIVIGDAFAYLREHGGFDLIFYDLSDAPLAPAADGTDIFDLVEGALAPKGRIAVQASSGLDLYAAELEAKRKALGKRFRKVQEEEVVIPSFLEQPWVFAFARKRKGALA
jgi:spermidine synthase